MQVDEENDSSELAMTSAAQDALDRMQQQVENNSGTKPSIGPDPLEAYGPPPPSSNTVTEAMVFSDDFSDEEDNSPPTSPSDMLEDYFETRSSTNSMMHHSSQEGEEPDARIRNHNSEIFDDPTDLSETNTGPFPADEERDNDLFCVSAAKPTAHGEDAGVITAPNKNTTVLSSDGDFGDFNGHLVQEEENEIDPSHVASFDEPSKNPSFEDVQTNILLTKEDDFGDFGVSDMSTKEDPGILNIESPETTQVAPALPEASTEDVEDDFGAFNDAAQDAETELDTTNEELLSPSDPSFEGAAAEDEDDFGDFGGYSTPAQEDPVTPIETEPAETLTQEEVVELESSTPAVQIETEENEFGDFDDAVFDIRNANDTTNADNDTTAPQVNILKTEDLKEGVVDEDEFGDFDEPQDVEHGRLENGDAAEVQPGLETGIVVDEEFGDFDEAGTDDFGDFEEVKTDEGTKSGAQVEETQPKPPSVKGDMNERWEAVFGEYNMRKSSQRKEKCSWRVSNAEEVLVSGEFSCVIEIFYTALLRHYRIQSYPSISQSISTRFPSQ